MNPPTAEAVRPVETPPVHNQGGDVIATFKDIDGTHTPITKECVEVIFVEDRPYLNHCLVRVEDEEAFLQASTETVERLLESGVTATNAADVPAGIITMYANYMSRRHGSEPIPELIVSV